jgi:hypothetical protein
MERTFRFADVSGEFEVSPDAQWALVRSSWDNSLSVFDYRSGNVRWTLPDEAVSPCFNGDGSEVLEAVVFDGETRLARWRSSDGGVIAPRAETYGEEGMVWTSQDSRYALIWETVGPGLPSWLISWINQVSPVQLMHWRVRFGVYDLKAEQKLVYVAEPGINTTGGVTVTFVDGGFIIGDDWNERRFCPLPPSRNWWWLFTWAVAPPAVVILLPVGTALRRRRHQLG